MDGLLPNRRNKAAFSNFSGVMWTMPNIKTLHVYETVRPTA